MNFFIRQPEDLDYSMPLEPMRLDDIGEQQKALKKSTFLSGGESPHEAHQGPQT